jgi:predicted DNA-binding ArsR family transcriptional regulator
MGGTDDASNLVELSVTEHAEAHRKLYEEYGKKEDYIAWKAISGQIGKEEILYEKARLGGYNSDGMLDKKHTIETKNKMSDAKMGYTRTLSSRNKQSKSVTGENNHFFGKTHSQKTREIMSEKKKELYKGSGNPNAQALKYNGIIYSTMKDLANELNVSNYWIRKMISNKQVLRMN